MSDKLSVSGVVFVAAHFSAPLVSPQKKHGGLKTAATIPHPRIIVSQ
jgi:hypothetical protein